MEAFVVIALIGLGLLLAELLLPTGGVLAVLGVAGLTAAGIAAFNSDSDVADYAGGALIALGILSGASFYFVTRKVLAAHRNERVRTGTEEMIGSSAEARSSIDPEGRVWLGGTIWSARLAAGSEPVRLGDRVRVEAVDGLTLVVRPEPQTAVQSREGAG
ncbi:MAG TPA: NfeD family protein [Solirubrobacterales bacterium]|jgi:membrane-bound serine protease (ClpP class)|nr:NfeD family protein [Solirubrobacterales bacterium]